MNYIVEEIEEQGQEQNKDELYKKLKGPNFKTKEEIKKKVKEEINLEDLFTKDRPLLNLSFNPFNENVGDNLLRFLTKQIIDGLEIIYRNYLVHFNIKPKNFLMIKNLVIKLIGLSLITKLEDQKELIIPKEAKDNLKPEYYSNESIPNEVAKRQDYFALGLTLFYLKYGTKMFGTYDFNEIKSDIKLYKFKYIYQKKVSQIKSDQFMEKDLIDFLCYLLDYVSDESSKFENIYRNKWLNKNYKENREIIIINHNDNKKAIIEFQKSDFLIEKEKDLNKKKKIKFKFKKRPEA